MNSRIQSRAAAVGSLVIALTLILMFAVESPYADAAAQTIFAVASVWILRMSGMLVGLTPVEDSGSPSLATLGKLAPWLVGLQIGMGILLRYKYLGAASHVGGAMFVGAFLLYFATGVMGPAPVGHPARTTATALLCVVVAQIVLGVAAYLVRFSDGSGQDLIPNTQLFTRMHSVTAMIAMGLTLVLGELVGRQEVHEPVS